MKNKFFSLTIFLESLKSNFISTIVVGIGNAIIAFVVILILSTLSLNSTKQSMLNMFNTANMEHTLKQGSVGMYASFVGGIEIIEKVLPEQETKLIDAYNLLDMSMSILTDSSYKISIRLLETSYKTACLTASGDTDEEKYVNAKESTISIIDEIFNFTDYSDIEINMIKTFSSNYIDQVYYYPDKSIDERINDAFYISVRDYAKTELGLNDIETSFLIYFLEEIEEEIKLNPSNKQTIIIDQISYYIGGLSKEYGQYLSLISESLLTGYINNSSAYINNEIIDDSEIGYKNKIYINAICDAIKLIFENLGYIEFLPNFEVKYVTNELGEPIYYENGNEIVIDNLTDRDKLIPVKSNMGTYSNILQKRYKEILTGSSYLEEEILQAKQEALNYFKDFEPLFISFFNEYFLNKDLYYDSTNNSIIYIKIQQKVAQIMKNYSYEVIPSFFGVDSIEEITLESIGISGNDLVNKVYDYSLSSITIFNSTYNSEINNGRNEEDSLLIALNQSSETLISEMPVDISVKLNDLASRNLYGLIVGVILFSLAGLLLPIVYSILTANNLVSQQVENGALAFTLSTPTNRFSIIFSKALYLIFSITSMYILLFMFSLLAREIGIAIGGTDFIESLTIKDISLYTLGAYFVALSISGICFLSSSIFNKTKYAIGIGGGVSVFFLVSAILGLFGSEVMPLALKISSMNFFNYLTIVSLFNVNMILEGNVIFYYLLIPLALLSVVTYLVGCIIFCKKDLPL